jgi:predicted site-specific integrase-resolvase
VATPGRSANRDKEKGEHISYATSGEFASTLGISMRTFSRWRSNGKVPEPASHTGHGWALWSPSQITEVLRRR